ncbi:MAG: OmpA family protein [Bacteriovoracaceae bacterium]|nr:OmpA family protein [Bacteriovoracaceae bacterium]
MADEDAGGEIAEEVKCEECVPGLPGWMATFSDLVTLLLTFFVLLLSFAKTESAKYEAALGSIRNAFGGNVIKHGETIERGKSPDDAPTMIDAELPVRPFPIEFMTMEGMLDKHEINRESDEDLAQMKNDLYQNELSDNVDVYEMPEGVKVIVRDKIYFEKGKIKPTKITIEVYERMVKMLKEKKWTVFVSGHASRGETSTDGTKDAFELSAARAGAVARSLIKRGVQPNRVVPVFYGDTNPVKLPNKSRELVDKESRRVEFLLRKRDLRSEGHKVQPK